jgi:nickel/cobalt exporter
MFWKEKGEDLNETQHGHLHSDDDDGGDGKTGQVKEKQEEEHAHVHWHKGTGYHTHLHVHQKRTAPTLAAIAGLALVLGFAHEEEFVILALAVGRVNPVLLMLSYATAVAAALIGVTVLAVKLYARIQHKVVQYTKYLPKLSALVLAAMAIVFAAGLL